MLFIIRILSSRIICANKLFEFYLFLWVSNKRHKKMLCKSKNRFTFFLLDERLLYYHIINRTNQVTHIHFCFRSVDRPIISAFRGRSVVCLAMKTEASRGLGFESRRKHFFFIFDHYLIGIRTLEKNKKDL